MAVIHYSVKQCAFLQHQIQICQLLTVLRINGTQPTLGAGLDWFTVGLMQINKLICIIHKLVKVVYGKTAYEDAVFVSENLRIGIKA